MVKKLINSSRIKNKRGASLVLVIGVIFILLSVVITIGIVKIESISAKTKLYEATSLNKFLSDLKLKAIDNDLVSLTEPIEVKEEYNGETYTLTIEPDGQKLYSDIKDVYTLDIRQPSGTNPVYGINNSKMETYVDGKKKEISSIVYLGENQGNLSALRMDNGEVSPNFISTIPTANNIHTTKEIKDKFGKIYKYLKVSINEKVNVMENDRYNSIGVDGDNTHPNSLIVLGNTVQAGDLVSIEYLDEKYKLIGWTKFVKGGISNTLQNSKNILVARVPVTNDNLFLIDNSNFNSGTYRTPLTQGDRLNSLSIGDASVKFCKGRQVDNPLIWSDLNHPSRTTITRADWYITGFINSPCELTDDKNKPIFYLSGTASNKVIEKSPTNLPIFYTGFSDLDEDLVDEILEFDTTPVLGYNIPPASRLYCMQSELATYAKEYVNKQNYLTPQPLYMVLSLGTGNTNDVNMYKYILYVYNEAKVKSEQLYASNVGTTGWFKNNRGDYYYFNENKTAKLMYERFRADNAYIQQKLASTVDIQLSVTAYDYNESVLDGNVSSSVVSANGTYILNITGEILERFHVLMETLDTDYLHSLAYSYYFNSNSGLATSGNVTFRSLYPMHKTIDFIPLVNNVLGKNFTAGNYTGMTYEEWVKVFDINPIKVPCVEKININQPVTEYQVDLKENVVYNLNFVNNIDSDYKVKIILNYASGTLGSREPNLDFKKSIGDKLFDVTLNKTKTSNQIIYTTQYELTKNSKYADFGNIFESIDTSDGISPQGAVISTNLSAVTPQSMVIEVSYKSLTDYGLKYKIQDSQGNVIEQNRIKLD